MIYCRPDMNVNQKARRRFKRDIENIAKSVTTELSVPSNLAIHSTLFANSSNSIHDCAQLPNLCHTQIAPLSNDQSNSPLVYDCTSISNNVTSDDNDAAADDDEEEEANFQMSYFKQLLFTWFVSHNVSKMAFTDLLKILTTVPQLSKLPLSAQTFLNQYDNVSKAIVKATQIQNIDGKQYVYYGVQNSATHFISSLHLEKKFTNLLLHINVDGVELHNNSACGLWVVSGMLPEISKLPFCIGYSYGNGKPELHKFLFPLVNELKSLMSGTNDCTLNSSSKDFSIKKIVFICDAPARSFIKCTKGQTGYFCCERCNEEGEYSYTANTVVFGSKICTPLRTDNSFRTKQHVEHHVGDSLLTILPNLDIVNDFVLDYMHLVCLGVFKRVLTYWLRLGNTACRLSGANVNKISDEIEKFVTGIPADFPRHMRRLNFIAKFKSIEYKQLLLFAGPVVFQDVLPEPVFQNFLLLHAAMFILLSPRFHLELLADAKKYLEAFVVHSCSIYGNDFCVYNVHSLLHIADDVHRHKFTLNELSAFPFESSFNKLKRLVKSGYKSAEQLLYKIPRAYCVTYPLKQKLLFSKHEITPSRHAFVFINNIKFSVAPPDCYLQTSQGVRRIRGILKQNNDVVFLCNHILPLYPLYEYPCSSFLFGVFYGEVDNKTSESVHRTLIETKYFAAKTAKAMAFFPLNYTKDNFYINE